MNKVAMGKAAADETNGLAVALPIAGGIRTFDVQGTCRMRHNARQIGPPAVLGWSFGRYVLGCDPFFSIFRCILHD